MKRIRDNQRSRVYKAENENWRSSPDERFYDHAATRAYCATVCDLLELPSPVDVVESKRATASCWYDVGAQVISMAPREWARRSVVLLHELSHHITPTAYPWHGGEFTQTLLALIDAVESADVHDMLASLFGEHDVRVGSRPRKALETAAELASGSDPYHGVPYVQVIYVPERPAGSPHSPIHPNLPMVQVGQVTQLDSYTLTLDGKLEIPSSSLRYVGRP